MNMLEPLTGLQSAIRKLAAGKNLDKREVSESLDIILGGHVSEAATAAFLVALAMKGETADEIRAILYSLRRHATTITPDVRGPLIDTCGTGGDSMKSFNISTAAAVVASAAGARVAKHGNRSVSGICGSADFLEYVGLELNTAPTRVQSCIENIGIGFLFAPSFHPSMKNLVSIRKTIGIRTVFNMVGPLCNPCTNISSQLVGVFDPSVLETTSTACKGYINEAMIVYAHDGFDELSNTCENDIVWNMSSGEIRKMRLHPASIGMHIAKPEQLVVTSKEDSIRNTLRAIYGKASEEKQDIVVLNAAAALLISKIALDFRDGIELSREAIKSGSAQHKLTELIEYCGDIEKLRRAEKEFL
jgi:anthranilate phosphoribosyltransferase